MPRFLLLVMLLAPLLGLADQVYRTTDEHGNVVFTDSPGPGVEQTEQVEIRPINTAPPPPHIPALDRSTKDQKDSAGSAYQLRITDPPNETSIPMGPGSFSVTALVQPPLRGGDALQLFIDDIPWSGPQSSDTWQLTNIFRGQHDLTVNVINSEGKSMATSAPVRVFVHRPSINFRNR